MSQTYAARAQQDAGTLTVSHPQDPAERQADQAADVVARGGSVAGWSFASVRAGGPSIHRDEAGPKQPTDADKYKAGAKKAGEALLETKAGKELIAKVEDTEPVKAIKKGLDTTAGKVIAGGVIAAGAGGLAAAKQPLPVQLPEITIAPGVSLGVHVEGPLNNPTSGGITLTFKEHGGSAKKGPTESDKIADETRRLRASNEMFKSAQQKAQEQADECAVVAAIFARSAQLKPVIPLALGAKPYIIEAPTEGKPTAAEPKTDAGPPVQREAVSAAPSRLDTSGVERVSRGGGRPLDTGVRCSMEALFGYDFSSVRIHDDAQGHAAADGVQANAFTVGDHIGIAAGQSSLSTPSGGRLLAHELAHVVQRGGLNDPLQRKAAGNSSKANTPPPSWEDGAELPAHALQILSEPGAPLDQSVASSVGMDDLNVAGVRIHTGDRANQSARALDATAYSVGEHIILGNGLFPPSNEASRGVVKHELRHVAHGGVRSDVDVTMRDDPEGEAQAHGDGPVRHAGLSGAHRHVLTRVGKWALKRLTEKEARMFISKHIAKHTRKIAGKAIHSIFRTPRKVQSLVRQTIEEGTRLAERSVAKVADEVLEEGGVRVTKQMMKHGQFAIVIEKDFMKAIGRDGETILRVILHPSGRLINAFPARALKGLGLGIIATEAFIAKTAEASTAVQASLERQATLERDATEASQDDDSWFNWIPYIGDLYGGSLNAGESSMLAAGREEESRRQVIETLLKEVVAATEQDRQSSLGPDEIATIREQMLMVLVSGPDVAGESDEDER